MATDRLVDKVVDRLVPEMPKETRDTEATLAALASAAAIIGHRYWYHRKNGKT